MSAMCLLHGEEAGRMGEWIVYGTPTLLAYLLGSIPFGYLIVKARGGQDIRAAGSGNIGATNVTRVMGAGAGAITLLLDAAKGYLAVWLAARASGGKITWMMVAVLAVILGHLFPIWLKFRGGRGVATGLGALLVISAKAVLAAAVIWLVVVMIWRYVSLGSLVAWAALPLLTYWLYAPGYQPPWPVSIGVTLAALLIIVKHRANLARLIAGTENRLTPGKPK